MTWTIDPHKHQHDERSYRHRIGQPYYGHVLRKIISAREPRPSIIDRATEYYSAHSWPAVVLLIIGAAFFAASIVFIVGCNAVSGCQPGESRCSGNVVEECQNYYGWQRQTVCASPRTCVFNVPASCGTWDVACCGTVTR